MATFQSLQNFGVPVNGGKQGPMLQPKKNHLFRARFLNFGNVGDQAVPLTLQVRTASLPSVTHETHEVHAYNSRAYYAGKHQWNEVELTVHDDITNSVNRKIDAQMQRQMDHYNQTGYRAATDYKFTYILEMMDGSNDGVLEAWEMEGSWISQYNPGSVDYSDSAPKTISLTIRYDNALHLDENGNLLMSSPGADPQGFTL